eukprot:10043222-Lingulodinium_polyedra.AAC.1
MALGADGIHPRRWLRASRKRACGRRPGICRPPRGSLFGPSRFSSTSSSSRASRREGQSAHHPDSG